MALRSPVANSAATQLDETLLICGRAQFAVCGGPNRRKGEVGRGLPALSRVCHQCGGEVWARMRAAGDLESARGFSLTRRRAPQGAGDVGDRSAEFLQPPSFGGGEVGRQVLAGRELEESGPD